MIWHAKSRASPAERMSANTEYNQSSTRFLWARTAMMAGCPGRWINSTDVRKNPHPFHFGWRAEAARSQKMRCTFSAVSPSVSQRSSTGAFLQAIETLNVKHSAVSTVAHTPEFHLEPSLSFYRGASKTLQVSLPIKRNQCTSNLGDPPMCIDRLRHPAMLCRKSSWGSQTGTSPIKGVAIAPQVRNYFFAAHAPIQRHSSPSGASTTLPRAFSAPRLRTTNSPPSR